MANANTICNVADCERSATDAGLCGAHYQRFKKHGDVQAHIPVARRAKRAGATCSAGACDRPVVNGINRLCGAHYSRLWREGAAKPEVPLAPPRSRPLPVQDHADGTRTCQECQARLPLDSFHNDSRGPGGKRKTCKTCRTARETARYNADPEAARAKMRKFRQENLDHVRAREAAAYERHRERAIASAIAQTHVRRARMAGRPYDRGISVSALRKRDGDRCYYCQVKMVFKSFPKGNRPGTQATLEHIEAIARGGSHTWNNCVLACWSCNIGKGARPYELMHRS